MRSIRAASIPRCPLHAVPAMIRARGVHGRGGGMSEREALLFANEAFYQAFADRDIAAMEAAWASDGPIACIHPGWPPLAGREAVIESWRRILANDESPQVV